MGLKQESELAIKDEKVSSYKPIVETRDPPVTFLEQFTPEKASEIALGALMADGREEMHKILGLEAIPAFQAPGTSSLEEV